MILPVTSGAASAVAETGATKTVSQTEFLQLFVAQLQHQDPLSPLEPNELTAQLAQFSSLEQLTAINARLDGLAGSAREANGAALFGLIGKEVVVDGSRIALKEGSAPEVSWTLAGPAQKVTVTVRDAAGNMLRVVDLGAQGAGAHTFRFDGRATDGARLPDGTYRLEVGAQAAGAAGPSPVEVTMRAAVDGVDLAADPPALLAGGLRITLDQVHEVHSPDGDS